MSNLINKIVIVGGGSAGWMSAASLIARFPDKDITLVESPNIATVGVGESTIAGIKNWVRMIGVKDEDFMAATDASYKLSIRFTNFYREDSGSFHYPFGTPTVDGNFANKNDWYFKKIKYPETPLGNYADSVYSNMALVNANKICKNENGEFPGFDFNKDAAYHFDATKFGLWLKEKFCLPKGVKHILAEVADIATSEDAGIESITLSTGETLTADLFIDCTGFKSLLLDKAIKEPFIPYTDMLPNNSAWATRVPYTNKQEQLVSYTDCEAIQNGWVWNIPLWSRMGTGYVYSDNYVSDENALEEFKEHLKKKGLYRDDLEYKNIKMRVGRHERFWVKNVCAIGLAAGFIEPLESNGLFSAHVFLHNLVRALDRGGRINGWDKEAYNSTCIKIFDNFAQFVALHYALSHRDDTQYWRDVGERKFSTQMTKQEYVPFTDLFIDAQTERMVHHQFISDYSGFHCILTGLNYFATDIHNLEYYNWDGKDLDTFCEIAAQKLDAKVAYWNRLAEDKPTLHDYLKENFYKDE
jgi:tryptophan halogenase